MPAEQTRGAASSPMNYLLALIFAAAGITCFVWYKSLSKAYAEFMAKFFKVSYGGFATRMKWDDPNTWQSMGYKLGMIGGGLFFIFLGLYLIFGTIHPGA